MPFYLSLPSRRFGLILCLLAGLGGGAFGAEPPLIELKTKTETLRGKSAAHNSQAVWLMEPTGRLKLLMLSDVTSFKKPGGAFRPNSAGEQRDQLRREFPRGFEVIGTGHYVVCAPADRARQYAELFESLYRNFHVYFTARGFKLTNPEFPLTAIVFPDQPAFAAYAKGDKVQAGAGLKGYYHHLSNRIVLFDNRKTFAAHETATPASIFLSETSSADPFAISPASAEWSASIEADLADTIIHEATHQVAFNTGLHTRLGDNPLWLVEGLATMFESPGIRGAAPGDPVRARLNAERFFWFANYRQARRKPKSLAAMLSSDDAFTKAPLDAYAEAWALTFFLAETRPAQYTRYLQTVAARPAFVQYDESQRLADFQGAFGRDLPLIEAAWLRYFDGLNATPAPARR